MPRAVPTSLTKCQPRLWNARRKINVSRGLKPAQLEWLRQHPFSQQWRNQASRDVVKFIDDCEGRDEYGQPRDELLPQQKLQLLSHPVKYFSRPHNVPESLRKQIYFPDFTVTFMRTPHLGPRFAQFEVPLWFSKLDMRSYLKNLYRVDVNHVRSFVVYQKVRREPTKPNRPYTRTKNYQPAYTKKMTVQLVDAFLWPKELSESQLNSNDYEKDRYWKTTEAQFDQAKELQQQYPKKPNDRHRRSIAEQAKALLQGKEQWKPTWQSIPQDVKVMQGRVSP